ncbi:MAG: alpha/beta hydrolase fold domain-containing protein [Alteromonadaceae bacterium]|nr:alpha/beta hydrolase fold domain-containing protein [Alteromonadaceae bacterium]
MTSSPKSTCNNYQKHQITDLQGDLQESFSKKPTLPLQNRIVRALARLLLKTVFSNKLKPGVSLKTISLNQTTIHLYTPEHCTSDGIVLWLHGGGYIVGSPKQNRTECSELAKKLGCKVVAVSYRLAPEHPFPAGLDDSYQAWQWLLDNEKSLHINKHKIAIAGQSAGGGLAAALCQRIKTDNSIQPIAQVLYYPMLDDRTALNRQLDKCEHLIWHNQLNYFAWGAYLGEEPGQSSVPRFSVPARSDNLSGLPNTWIGVGEMDLFYQENIQYAEALNASGVNVCVHTTPRAAHAFDVVAPSAVSSRDFKNEIITFLNRLLEN